MKTVEWRELMEEPPAGHGHGRVASDNPNLEGRHVSLETAGAQADAFMRAGGWSLVETGRGSGRFGAYGDGDAGMTTHRGVLRGDEHVDREALVAAVEKGLGFTREEVFSVYRQGRLSADQGELRARIDARLLALSRAGAQVHLLGGALGLGMSPGGDGGEFCPAVRNALARARLASRDSTEGDA